MGEPPAPLASDRSRFGGLRDSWGLFLAFGEGPWALGSSLGLGEGPWVQGALWGPSLVPRDPAFAGDWPDPVLHRAAEELSPWVAAVGQPRAVAADVLRGSGFSPTRGKCRSGDNFSLSRFPGRGTWHQGVTV